MIKIIPFGNMWMITKSVVSVTAIVGYSHCHTPRHIINWGTAVSMRRPHIGKVALVLQRVAHSGLPSKI
ncbi:UNVERIFIED_CONTAM: hypothetical protein NCL1_30075 [Trichonephila clavipes]